MAKVKFHRCPLTFLPEGADSCKKVQNALDEQGIEYEIDKEWGFPRGRRKDLIELTGDKWLPAIEFEDGSAYRAESKEMAQTIRDGRLFEHQNQPAA